MKQKQKQKNRAKKNSSSRIQKHANKLHRARNSSKGSNNNDNNNNNKKKKKTSREQQQHAHATSDHATPSPFFNVAKYERKAKDAHHRPGKKLTQLQSAFEHRLQESKFRLLNEKLYSLTGDEAQAMFAKDPQLFSDYHKGYRSAVENWETDPVDDIVQFLNQRRMRDKVVADMGCGEAKIAQRVKRDHLRQVHSFDLVALNEHVTACNIANTPLEDESVDVVVFCLSLMGTNFYDYLLEAHRVLCLKGHVIVAETESRIVSKLKFFDVMRKMGMNMERESRPNGLFRIFHFTKVASEAPKRPNTAIDKIFKPWVYKKRDGKT